jgi:transcriptional regulator with XRE-family HTH domain
MPKTSNKSTTKTDKLVGQNIRIHRLSKGLTLAQLGAMLGVTLMQIRKYETGVDRVSSGRLYEIAQLLDVPPTAFFKGSKVGPAGDAFSFEFLDDPMCLQMLQQFSKLHGRNKRRLVLGLVEQLVRELKR